MQEFYFAKLFKLKHEIFSSSIMIVEYYTKACFSAHSQKTLNNLLLSATACILSIVAFTYRFCRFFSTSLLTPCSLEVSNTTGSLKSASSQSCKENFLYLPVVVSTRIIRHRAFQARYLAIHFSGHTQEISKEYPQLVSQCRKYLLVLRLKFEYISHTVLP